MQSSAGRRAVCSARGGLSRDCYAGTLYPSNEGNPLVLWWIAVTLLWPGRGDFSASGLSTFKKIALTSAPDCIMTFLFIERWIKLNCLQISSIWVYLKQEGFWPWFLRFQAETNQFPTEQILNQCPQAKFTQSHMCCSISGTVPLVGYHALLKKNSLGFLCSFSQMFYDLEKWLLKSICWGLTRHHCVSLLESGSLPPPRS